MAKDGNLYSVMLKSFWSAVKKPTQYINIISKYLEELDMSEDKRLEVEGP